MVMSSQIAPSSGNIYSLLFLMENNEIGIANCVLDIPILSHINNNQIITELLFPSNFPLKMLKMFHMIRWMKETFGTPSSCNNHHDENLPKPIDLWCDVGIT